MSTPDAPAAPRKGHPLGLYFLFGTEMWERFSYYGMRALLVLYLVEHHGWQPEQSSGVYKWYTSLVYLTPLIGGFLADRFLGLRASIIAGGVLMAIGHFLMAFEPLPIFYTALAFLIAGNGFFKPNISTLVGKMYTKDDDRRDGAFTIFYMGINIGAGLSPIICGWLREHKGFHWGFGAAGVGMCIGLLTFLVGQRRIRDDVHAAGNDLLTSRERSRLPVKLPEPVAAKEATEGKPDREAATEAPEKSDEDKPAAKALPGMLATIFPFLLMAAAITLPVFYGWQVKTGAAKPTDLIMPVAFGLIFMGMGITLRTIRGAARDKSIVIFVLFIFVVLFWMAFEQAGNALNLWAEFHTRLAIGGFKYPAEWFQSVNAVLIVIFAPLFSLLWLWLARRGKEPRTPVKMFVAMVLMALSFVVMIFGAIAENRSEAAVTFRGSVPAGVLLGAVGAEAGDGRQLFACGKKQPGCAPQDAQVRFDGGRLTAKDNGDGTVTLHTRGVLPRYVVNDLLKTSAPKEFVAAVEGLDDDTKEASAGHAVVFGKFPAGWKFTLDVAKAKKDGVVWDATRSELTFTKRIDAPTTSEVISAGAPAEFRDAIWALETESAAGRVGGMWLFLSYLLATLGELCLSPVGLSMVTKLAPARFASLFMGVWLLGSSVAQYVGGSVGESWGKITPTDYFTLFVWTSFIGAGVLLLLVWPLKKLMHEVH